MVRILDRLRAFDVVCRIAGKRKLPYDAFYLKIQVCKPKAPAVRADLRSPGFIRAMIRLKRDASSGCYIRLMIPITSASSAPKPYPGRVSLKPSWWVPLQARALRPRRPCVLAAASRCYAVLFRHRHRRPPRVGTADARVARQRAATAVALLCVVAVALAADALDEDAGQQRTFSTAPANGKKKARITVISNNNVLKQHGPTKGAALVCAGGGARAGRRGVQSRDGIASGRACGSEGAVCG